jgi:hypothetical protein
MLFLVNPVVMRGHDKNQGSRRRAPQGRSLPPIKLQHSIIPSAKTPQNKNLLFIRTVAVDLYSSCDILESLDRHNTNKKELS